jgi:hypothetical protein
VQEAQSITFYKKLIDQILKNVSNDRPLDAVVRLWTSAITLFIAGSSSLPGFYSIWNEALREDDPAVMRHVASLSRLLNMYCCKLRRQVEVSAVSSASAGVPTPLPLPTQVPWPADGKLHRGGGLGPATLAPGNLAWYQNMIGKWYRSSQYLATSLRRDKAEEFMLLYGGANKVAVYAVALSLGCIHGFTRHTLVLYVNFPFSVGEVRTAVVVCRATLLARKLLRATDARAQRVRNALSSLLRFSSGQCGA